MSLNANNEEMTSVSQHRHGLTVFVAKENKVNKFAFVGMSLQN